MPVKGSRQPRICKKCGEDNPTKFYPNDASECGVCHRERSSARQRGNKDLHRRRHLRRAYGITPEQYDAQLEKQNGLCAVCGKPPDPTDLQKNLVVDHDHETKKFRALVHGRCNSILGYAQDNVEILLAAAVYLNKYRDF